MKTNFLIVCLCILSVNCGRPAESFDSKDSLYTDTTSIDLTDSTYVTAADAPDILGAVEKLVEMQKQRTPSYFTIRLHASGLEYQTDEVWSFDSLMNLAHCYQDWSSEGVEGKTHHFFQKERLYAIKDENYYDGVKDLSVYHLELGGVTIGEKGNPPDSTATPLGKKYFTDAERDLKRTLNEMLKLLRENQQKITKDDPAFLHVESESTDEEIPGTETTEITIDRELLGTLLR